jgi:hypothetical protein
MSFVRENLQPLDHTKHETWEQMLTKKHILNTDVVLELGARYGCVSVAIQSKKPKYHYAVEPDPAVWEALETNLANFKCDTTVLKGFLSKTPLVLMPHSDPNARYSMPSEEFTAPSKSLQDLATNFNALVADCEGFLETFFKQNPTFANGLRICIFEADNPNMCNYDWVKDHLRASGLFPVEEGFQNVWIRRRAKLVTYSNNPTHPGLLQFIKSVDKFKWDYHIVRGTEWHNFGTKHVKILEYVSTLSSDYTHVFVVDSHDVCVLGTMNEALSKLSDDDIVFNAEKACWPDQSQEIRYPPCQYKTRFLNGGVCFARKDVYLDLAKQIRSSDDDQRVFTKYYLDKTRFKDKVITLDTSCKVFQCYSFVESGEFTFTSDTLINAMTNTRPVIIHGNGRTDMSKVYGLL